MKIMKYILFFFLCNIGLVSAQDLGQYKYVQVPQSFDFLKEQNQYQLNAMAAFLFEKEGFEVLYGEGLPKGLDGCEMLKAHVKKDGGIFTTKLQVTLENCKGATVFTSKMGSSREKDFEKAFQEALRDAFTSLETLDYSYTGAGTEVAEKKETEINEATPPEEAVAEKLDAEKAVPEVIAEKVVAEIGEETQYLNGSTPYTLKKTSAGFTLYRGEGLEEFATLLKSGGGSNYLFASEKLRGSAYFDAEGNLLVEYLDVNTEQLVTVRYQLQD